MPQSPDAERAVLGAILVNNHAFYRVIGTIDTPDFFKDSHRTIFATMRRMAEQSQEIEPLTLKEELAKHAERMELLLSRGLADDAVDPATGRAPPLAPVAINATPRVRIDYETVHAEGNLLHVDFGGDAFPGLVLKAGVQPAVLLAQDEAGVWYSTADFEELEILPQNEPPALATKIEERLVFKVFRITVRAARER
jgi:hypothetical protein